jgi:hypothetical protein
MGMAQPHVSRTPKPIYKNTVVCPHCHAEYNPKTKWMWVVYRGATSSEYRKLSNLPEGKCPACFR